MSKCQQVLLRLLGDDQEQKRIKRFIADRVVVLPNGCHEFVGVIQNKGYGAVCFWGATPRAHQIVWVLANGQLVPEGLMVMHKCNNRACVNIDHLEVGTNTENMRYAKLCGSYVKQQKLSREKVLEVARMKAAGLSQRTIAERFGINPKLVFDVLHGRRWPECWGEVQAILNADGCERRAA